MLDAGIAENANERFRPTMEDAHVVDLDLVPPQHLAMSTSRENTGYFAVYDGHGGKAAVDLVSQNLHRHLQHELNSATPEVAIRQAFLKTDAEMKGKPAYAECGSTAVCALILPSAQGRTLLAANAGDARAVLARVGPGGILEAVRLTRDHKPDVYEESVRVAKAGGWVMRGRLDGSLAVSRALGDFNYKERGLICEPDVLTCELDERHLFLILACDGLWDVVKDEEAVLQVCHMEKSRAMAQALVDLAMNKGTTDNVTVMVVRLQKHAPKRSKTSR
jgi:serine/threonine protein phosphatase PrpC